MWYKNVEWGEITVKQTPIERNLRKIVSSAVKSALKAETELQRAREQRGEMEKAVKRAQRKAQREQTGQTQRAYEKALSRLETARATVAQKRTVATETRRAQRAAERRLTAFEKSDTNPYTGERYTHIFEPRNLSRPDLIMQESDTMSYTDKRSLMREMKQKISRRIRSLRDTRKQYGDEVPISDAETEYEAIKNLSPSDTDNFETILLFYNKLFYSDEFEAGTIKDYRGFIEGVNELSDELTDSGFTDKDVKDFYRVLNLVKKYFPDYYDDSETRKQIKLRLDSGMTWYEVYDSLKKWWGTEQEEQDRLQSQKNTARRKQEQDQAKQARFKQKQREIMEKRKKRGV